MVTSCPFGFISYNTHDNLKRVLEGFIAEEKFSRCACWYHESLGTEKDHFHCWIEPVHQIDTSSIVERFVEFDDLGNKNSIAIKSKCKSDWNNAYLYGIHDEAYLRFKNKKRELVNIKSDFHIYLGDFEDDIAQAEYWKFNKCLAPYERIMELVMQGQTLEQIYIKLRTSFDQLNSVRNAYNAIKKALYDKEQEELIAHSSFLNRLGFGDDDE